MLPVIRQARRARFRVSIAYLVTKTLKGKWLNGEVLRTTRFGAWYSNTYRIRLGASLRSNVKR